MKCLITNVHNHSEYSHDSVCSIADMYLAHLSKGADIFAVTDHSDVFAFDRYDLFTLIQKA